MKKALVFGSVNLDYVYEVDGNLSFSYIEN